MASRLDEYRRSNLEIDPSVLDHGLFEKGTEKIRRQINYFKS